MTSLLSAVGGRDALELIVVGLVARITADPELAPFFEDVSRARHERILVDYLCAFLSDRRGSWRGRDLRSVHADLSVSPTHFRAFLGHLVATLAAAGVPAPVLDQVLDALRGLEDEIVAGAHPG